MQASQSIGSVERETGLTKDTLRVWERRYHFPQPVRDAFGERTYPSDQIAKLRLLKRLLDHGFRPGKIIHCSMEELQNLSENLASRDMSAKAAPANPQGLQSCLSLCRHGSPEELRRTLARELVQAGLQHFVLDIMAPLNVMVGNAWAKGEISVFQEHFYSEAVQMVLRHSIASLPPQEPASRPRVLLTTLPREQHGLGLLMAEAMLTLQGAFCIALGTQTPVIDIVRAAAAQQADIVGLSVSSAMNANQVLDGLAELRSKLPDTIELWAGGRNPVLARRPPQRVRVMDLDQVPAALAEWRSRHGKQEP